MSEQQETLLEFPCDFPIKVMGPNTEEFEALIVSLTRRHAPDLSDRDIRTRASANGTYQSVTLTVRATSREQLDAIYYDITACEQVKMAL